MEGLQRNLMHIRPVTPHPEKINCKQCHVTQNTQSLFKGTNFPKILILQSWC